MVEVIRSLREEGADRNEVITYLRERGKDLYEITERDDESMRGFAGHF